MYLTNAEEQLMKMLWKLDRAFIRDLLNEFPDTRYREELTYLTIKSHYLYAENSVPAKRQERFQEVISEYYVLADQYPQSKYLKEAERFYNRAVEIIKKQ